ncbi:MAG TPA: hypothetical protein VIW69_18110 [Candidatus Elarobacter sp.]
MTGDAAVWNAWTTVTTVNAPPATRARLVRVRLPQSIDPGPVAGDGGRGNQTVAFPESGARWLRVRVADPQAPGHRQLWAVGLGAFALRTVRSAKSA